RPWLLRRRRCKDLSGSRRSALGTVKAVCGAL
ncbi:uncharacterized protein METZ01_LOCUS319913, partial [marine metagenome]